METNLFDDSWFLNLSPEYKLLYIYILLRCNHAGIWQVNFKLANFHLFEFETRVDEQSALNYFKDIIEVVKPGYWYIKKFVEYQYGKLGESNVHQSVRRELSKYGIETEERVITSATEPTLEEVIAYFESLGHSKTDAENFYSYYSAQGWETKSGTSIKARWRNKVIGFMNNQKQFQTNKTAPAPVKKSITGKCSCGKKATMQIEGINVCSYDCFIKNKKGDKK